MPAGAPGGGGSVSKDPSNRRHPEPTHRRRTFGPSWVNSDPNTPQPGDHHHDHPPQTSHRYRRLSDLRRRGLRPAAHAADVTLYGSIDTGILFQRVDTDRAGEDARNNVKMNSSSHTPNRWGLKGAEDLGNGLAVGFNLEGQFGSDDGSMVNGRLFQRAAQVWLKSDAAGTFIVGRSGQLRSGLGTTGIFATKVAPFSLSFGEHMVGHKWLVPGLWASVDNALTWQSPVFAGWQVHLQYSGQVDQVKASDYAVEFENSSDRLWGAALTYTGGPVHAVLIADSVMYSDEKADYDDNLTVSAAFTYDFGPWTLMTSAFWFQDAKGSNFLGHADMKDVWTRDAAGNADPATYKGYALQVGALIDTGGGTVKVNMGWMDAKVDKTYYGFDADQVLDAERFGVAAAYFYPLSKRTQVYAGAGWTKDKSSVVKGSDPSAWEAVSGLVVWF